MRNLRPKINRLSILAGQRFSLAEGALAEDAYAEPNAALPHALGFEDSSQVPCNQINKEKEKRGAPAKARSSAEGRANAAGETKARALPVDFTAHPSHGTFKPCSPCAGHYALHL